MPWSQVLRQLLLDALIPGTVVWNANFMDYAEGKGRHVLDVRFTKSNNDEVGISQYCIGANILVGADGIWSSVRRFKLGMLDAPKDYDARYLGVMVILGRATYDHELTSCSPQK
jgi:2-polyprenyl-6-methoxyphenol hydroxylase-like FAD-dependent oxidoreductase